MNSPVYKMTVLLHKAFNKAAPLGTRRRRAAKGLLRLSYKGIQKGRSVWRRAGEKKTVLQKTLSAQNVPNEAWPADRPLLSVVIPCFNYGKYVAEAVDSVLAQTFQDFEIIIVDGGSTDGTTPDVLRGLNRPKTSVRFREGRHLAGDNRNFGIGLARGKYICCLDADDRLDPTYLEKALFLLESYRYDAVYPSVQCFGADSRVLIAQPTNFERMITVENAVSTVAVFSRTAWEQSGGYKDWPVGTGHVPEDWEYWARLMGLGFRFRAVPEPLMLYRVHSTGLTGQCTTTLSEQLAAVYAENRALLEGPAAQRRRENSDSFYRVTDPALNLKHPKSRRRILLAVPFMVIGGADTILLRIFESLRAEYDLTVVTSLEAPAEYGDNTEEYRRITPEVYHLRRFLADEDEMRDFVHYLIESREIDLVFLVGCEFVYHMLPEIKRRHPGIRIIDQLFNEFGHIRNNRRFAGLIDLNIVANDAVRNVLVQKYGEDPDKVRVIIHGIGAPESAGREAPDRMPPGLADGRLTLSYFGRFSEEKAPDLFVEIIRLVKDCGIQAVMTGNGPEYRPTLERIAAAGLQETIHAPGFVDDIRPYLARTDILLVPSRIEGLPIIILEALNLGVPVIASDIGGISTVVRNGYNGYVCPAGQVGEFAARVRELAGNPGLLAAMKKNALDFARENICEERMNAAYAAAIRQELSRGGT